MSGRWRRIAGIATPALVAGGYLLVAALSLALTKGQDGIATVWPASGVLLAALLKTSADRIARQIAWAAGASFAVNLAFGNTAVMSTGFTVANMVEPVVATLLLRRWCGRVPSFIVLVHVLRFSAACMLAAACSAAIAWRASGGGTTFIISWFSTDLLGMLIVTPLVLTIAARLPETGRRGQLYAVGDAALWLAPIAAATMVVFLQSSYPTLFVPLVVLLAVTYRLGPFGAAAGVLIIATIGSVLTRAGYGPLTLMQDRDATSTALFLQFYILTLFGSALPLAALLDMRARLTAQLADRERSYRLLADNSRDMIVRLGLDGVRRYVSPACRDILGYEPSDMVGVTPAGAIHPDDRVRAMAACRDALAGARETMCTYRQTHADGRYVWLEAVYTVMRDEQTGDPIELIASVRDVSRRQAAELAAAQTTARLMEGHRLLSMAEQVAHVGHWRLDAVGGAIVWSDEVFRIHGLEGPIAPPLDDAITAYHPDDRTRVTNAVQAAIDNAAPFEFEARIVRPDGAVRHIISHGQIEQAPDGTVLAVIGVIQDITLHREVEAQLEAARVSAVEATTRALTIAATDELTGLASRRQTMRTLDDAVAHAQRSGTPLSVAMFDIDHFKAVNDTFGHAVGDDVLRRVAASAKRTVRPSDLVGRIGGEEFAIILPGADSIVASAVAERLRRSMEASTEGNGPNVTVSIGLASFRNGMTGAVLLQRADHALYAAKAAGRNVLRLAS